MNDTQRFLHELFDGKPQHTAIQIWHKQGHTNHWFTDIDEAAAHAAQTQDHDVYVAAGIAPLAHKMSRTTRTPANEVCGIPGVWADIDVNGGPEGKTGAAPTIDDAVDLARSLITPSIVIGSGYGVQAWWLWEDEPWMFDGTEHQAQAARLVQAFQGALRAEARRRGYGIDSVHDLGRLMRIPGTRNHKGSPALDVVVIENESNRYSIDAVGELSHSALASISQATVDMQTGKGIEFTLSEDGRAVALQLENLRDEDNEVMLAWTKKPSVKTRNWTHSEWELKLAGHLQQAYWTDQEIADALVYYRLKYEPGDPRKKNRHDRIAATIGKVRARSAIEEVRMEREEEANDALEQLDAISKSSTNDTNPVRTISLFNRVIGGPEIAELVQDSTDPDLARFRLILADGREVPLGDMATLTDQNKFRNIYATVTQHLPTKAKGPHWDAAIQSMLKTATVNQDHEDTREAVLNGWLESYVSAAGSNDKDGACLVGEPFIHDGLLHVHQAGLMQWLRKIRSERIDRPTLQSYLASGGFERKTINYMKPTGGKTSRSYYVQQVNLLGFRLD